MCTCNYVIREADEHVIIWLMMIDIAKHILFSGRCYGVSISTSYTNQVE